MNPHNLLGGQVCYHYIISTYFIEPQDFHLWEQWLGSCLQPLPAVFPLLATNISNYFTLLLHISMLLRDFLFGRSPSDLNREPARYPTNDAYQLHQTSNLCYHRQTVVRTEFCRLVHGSTYQYGFILTTRFFNVLASNNFGVFPSYLLVLIDDRPC